MDKLQMTPIFPVPAPVPPPMQASAPASTRLRLARIVGLSLLGAAALAGCGKNYTAYALTSTGTIIQFTTNKPTSISSNATVNGLSGSDTLLQLAYLPTSTVSPVATLYGVTSGNEVCQVDPTTAAVSGCLSPFTTDTLSNVTASFDPVTGMLRVVANDTTRSGGYLDVLIDPTSGAAVSSQIGTSLTYSDSTSGKPQINAIAYSNPYSNAGSTTLYALDVNSLKLARIGDSDASNATSVTSGGVNTIGSTDVTFTANSGLAISPQDGTAYAALGNAASLYTIDLSSGLATLVGAVHNSDYTVISLVIAPDS